MTTRRSTCSGVKNKRLTGEEIAEIPLITRRNGVVLTVGDLGVVNDGFVDSTSISRINGEPGMAVTIEAAAREDVIAMTSAVREYAEAHELPTRIRVRNLGRQLR